MATGMDEGKWAAGRMRSCKPGHLRHTKCAIWASKYDGVSWLAWFACTDLHWHLYDSACLHTHSPPTPTPFLSPSALSPPSLTTARVLSYMDDTYDGRVWAENL